jgi:hypothetical protein
MYRSDFAAEADRYARLAAEASKPNDRDLFLSMETSWRAFAESQRRIDEVRNRHKTMFARKPVSRSVHAAESL